MAKSNVPKSKNGEKELRVAQELLRQFGNLSGEIRSLLTEREPSPEALTHVADGIQDTMDAIQGVSTASDLRRAATKVRAQAAHGARTLQELECFAGRLEGLAWARDAYEQAQHFSE